MIIEYEIDNFKTVAGLPAPSDWLIIESIDREGARARAWERLIGPKMFVIESIVEKDDKTWLHVSVSFHNRKMPSYDDLQLVRMRFIGDDKECYMIFPHKERYVNINKNVLHLFCCLSHPDGVLPRMENTINGMIVI